MFINVKSLKNSAYNGESGCLSKLNPLKITPSIEKHPDVYEASTLRDALGPRSKF